MKTKNKNSDAKPEKKVITEEKKELDRSEAVGKADEKTWLEELAELEPKDGVFAVPPEFITPEGGLDVDKLNKHAEEVRRKIKERKESAERKKDKDTHRKAK